MMPYAAPAAAAAVAPLADPRSLTPATIGGGQSAAATSAYFLQRQEQQQQQQSPPRSPMSQITPRSTMSVAHLVSRNDTPVAAGPPPPRAPLSPLRVDDPLRTTQIGALRPEDLARERNAALQLLNLAGDVRKPESVSTDTSGDEDEGTEGTEQIPTRSSSRSSVRTETSSAPRTARSSPLKIMHPLPGLAGSSHPPARLLPFSSSELYTSRREDAETPPRRLSPVPLETSPAAWYSSTRRSIGGSAYDAGDAARHYYTPAPSKSIPDNLLDSGIAGIYTPVVPRSYAESETPAARLGRGADIAPPLPLAARRIPRNSKRQREEAEGAAAEPPASAKKAGKARARASAAPSSSTSSSRTARQRVASDSVVEDLPAVRGARPSPRPLDISALELADRLTPAERELCSVQRIKPRDYLHMKSTLCAQYRRLDGDLSRRSARKLFSMDVNKVGRVYDLVEAEGYLVAALEGDGEPEHAPQQQEAGPSRPPPRRRAALGPR